VGLNIKSLAASDGTRQLQGPSTRIMRSSPPNRAPLPSSSHAQGLGYVFGTMTAIEALYIFDEHK
jgi:hypothetical protein